MARPRKPSLKVRDVTTAAAATTTEKKRKKKATTTTTTAAKSKLKAKKKTTTTTTTAAAATTATAKRTTNEGAAGAAPAAGAPRSRKKSVKVEEMEKTAPLLVGVEGMEEEEEEEMIVDDDDEEWDEEQEKKEQKKKKQKKTKTGAAKKRKAQGTPDLLIEVFTNPRLVQDLFVNPKWIAKRSDLIALGSTCKARSELRLGPETLTVDLKHHKYRYIHRFVGALAERPLQNLKSLSLSRIHSAELCDEVKNCLGAGNLLQLENLTLEGSYQHAMKDLLVPLVPAHLPALRSLTLRDMKISKGGPSWKKFQKALKSWLSVAHKERRKEEKKEGVVKKKRKAATKVKAPVVCPLVHLESLTLEGIAVPKLVFHSWMEALYKLNTRPLQELTLIGVDVGTATYLSLAEMIQKGHFRKLEAFHLDNFHLEECHAVQFIEALSSGCDALLELQLGNTAGRGDYRYRRRGVSTSGKLLVAKLVDCSDGGGLQSLEVLTLAWEGFDRPRTLAEFLFGADFQETEEAATGAAKNNKELPFPNLYSFGLQAMKDRLKVPYLCDVVKACVKREVYQIDLRYNVLDKASTLQIVETAKSLITSTLPRGEVLHLHLAQFRYRRAHESPDYRSHVRRPAYIWRQTPRIQSYSKLPKALRVYVEKAFVK